MATLDFGAYLQKLTVNLVNSYTREPENRNLRLDLEPAYLGMDAAIPLGIIVNELISNSLKHAFPPGQRGEIRINLHKNKLNNRTNGISEGYETGGEESKNGLDYTLVIADNGSGISEEIDLENTDSLGLQLINILVHQIEGYLELKRENGTEFRISFNNATSSNNYASSKTQDYREAIGESSGSKHGNYIVIIAKNNIKYYKMPQKCLNQLL